MGGSGTANALFVGLPPVALFTYEVVQQDFLYVRGGSLLSGILNSAGNDECEQGTPKNRTEHHEGPVLAFSGAKRAAVVAEPPRSGIASVAEARMQSEAECV